MIKFFKIRKEKYAEMNRKILIYIFLITIEILRILLSLII